MVLATVSANRDTDATPTSLRESTSVSTYFDNSPVTVSGIVRDTPRFTSDTPKCLGKRTTLHKHSTEASSVVNWLPAVLSIDASEVWLSPSEREIRTQ